MDDEDEIELTAKRRSIAFQVGSDELPQPGEPKRRQGEINTRHAPSLLREIARVASRAARDIERASRLQHSRGFDDQRVRL